MGLVRGHHPVLGTLGPLKGQSSGTGGATKSGQGQGARGGGSAAITTSWPAAHWGPVGGKLSLRLPGLWGGSPVSAQQAADQS